jgi:hypothetical protein
VLFPALFHRPVRVCFDEVLGSSDGGAVLLKAADDRLGLTAALAGVLRDARQVGKVRHSLEDLFAQRIFALACGYPDANDAARLADDPVYKLLLGRDPVDGDALASQPTISRFENGLSRIELYRLGDALAERVIEHHRQRRRGRARCITIDLDPTDDPTHGAQQLTFFNAHYDTWCYLPVLGFLRFDHEAEQHLFTAVLRAGNAPPKLGAIGLLRRVLARCRHAFPGTRFLIRLDGGFAGPELLDFLDDQPDVDYVVAVAKNSVLARRAHRLMGRARRRSRETGQTEHVYGECRYAAGSWSQRRRVIIKAEVVRLAGRAPRDNPRFVITNLPQSPRWIYRQIYCDRGDVENRIKELQNDLALGRTSCSRFWANQLRVLLVAAAYVLLQEIRRRAARTDCARAQVITLRDRLLKLGTRVAVSTRHLVLHLPATCPHRRTWRRIALALGADAG